MDVANFRRPRERVDIAVILQILGRILEPRSAGILFVQLITADRRAHGPIHDRDAFSEELAQGGFGGGGGAGLHKLTYLYIKMR